MEVFLTERSLREGVLRVWLRRVPVEGGVLVAVAKGTNGNWRVGEASLYGRGQGSTASGRTMLLFNIIQDAHQPELVAGDAVRIMIEGSQEGQFLDIDLDILSVE